MTKELKIVDYGKDYGFGRWVVTAPSILEKPFGTDTFDDVLVLVDEFGNEDTESIKEKICQI